MIILAVVMAFNLPLVFGSYFAGLDKHPPTIFFEERRTVTFFSALFMACTSLTSFLIAWVHFRVDHAHPVANFWWLSGCGFLYLSLDDYFQAHEGIDSAVLRLLGINPAQYKFDGLVIGAFGLIALAVCLRFRAEILKRPTFVFLLMLGGVGLFGTVLFDQLESPIGHDLSVPIEESFKVIGTAMFFAGYQTVLFDFLKPLLPSVLNQQHKSTFN